ncbi:MAG: hypothetical protein J1E34_03770 [Oscillospiraceae bacterium]|nr:hypothetical protein [Oscillospiraceae bacterium]
MKNEICTTKKEMNLVDNMKIEHKTREIIITKRMQLAAGKFGSEEYNVLNQVRKDNPEYSLVVREIAKSKARLKLNYDFMVKYIEKHDDENKSIMSAFREEQQKMKKQEGELPERYSFGNIRKWFLEKYPEVKNYIENTKKAA